MKWKPALYEQSVVQQVSFHRWGCTSPRVGGDGVAHASLLLVVCDCTQLLEEQFQQYIDRVKKSDCQAELRRMLAAGPPIFISDKHAFPLDEGETHVVKLWYASDGEERSAKLVGAVEGAERDELWESLKSFIIVEGKEEGDDDDKEETTEET